MPYDYFLRPARVDRILRGEIIDHFGCAGRSTAGGSSPSGRPGCSDPHRIERSARRHEQAAPTITAKANIGTTLRQVDAPDGRPGLVEDHDAVEAIAS